MSTTRYSGDLTITLTYRDRQDDYRATITAEGMKGRHTVYVGRLPTQSADAPGTFDSVAHAALSFASEELGSREIENYAALDDRGWSIARSKHLRWGGPLHEKAVKHRAKAARAMGPVARMRARR